MNSQLSPEEAAQELLIRRRARIGILDYVNAIEVPGKPSSEDPDEEFFLPVETTLAHHHRLLLEKLDELSRTKHGRMMVFMPPGSAKSTYASVVFPSRFLGQEPGRKVILASYGDDLARKLGRRTRQIARSKRFKGIWECELSPDSSAADEWSLTNGSEYMACGILGGITGNRAHGIIIDDPIKGREQAESQTIRQKTWDAYEDDLKTRLIPGGWMLIIQCMTGDTQVLMADGTNKALRDVRPGDSVATYDNGSITHSVVKNWANQGPDRVFKIRTTSGTIARANERHPFLVARNGRVEWVRLRDLMVGDEIIRATASGENIAELNVPLKDATCLQNARAFACPITTKTSGQVGIEHHQSTHKRDGTPTSSIDTASPWLSTTPSLPSKEASAPYAKSRQEQMYARIGAESSASIIATTAGKCAASCATIATLQSATAKPQTYCGAPLNTYKTTPDRIVEIVEDGYEDVFDIEVDRTENFIANGLVSHNTRWHEDDLSGRILPDGWDGQSGKILCKDGNEWEVVCLQAQCETDNDPLGRKPGEYLWPEWFDERHWDQFKNNQRTWYALFQQKPRPSEGGELRREWVRHYRDVRAGQGMNKLILVDPSSGRRKNKSSDYTSMWVIGLASDGNAYVLDMVRDKLNLTGRARMLMGLHRKWRPYEVRYEQYGMQADIEHIQSVMEAEQYRFKITEVAGGVLKEDRIRRLIPAFQNAKLWLPETFWYTRSDGKVYDLVAEFINEEYLAFPVGRHDDMLDSLARLFEPGPEFALRWPHQQYEAPNMPQFRPTDAGFGVLG